MPTLTLRPNGTEHNEGPWYPAWPDEPHLDYPWEAIDDVVSDEDESYCYRFGAPASVNRFYLTNHTTEQGDIIDVTVYARCKRTPAGNVWLHVKTHGVAYSTQNAVETSWTTFSREYTTNPNTSQPWTWDEIDDLIIGHTIGGPDINGYCTQMYVEVEYQYPIQTIAPISIASEEAFGTPQANLIIKSVGAIASAEAFGTLIIEHVRILLYKTFAPGQVDGIRLKFANTGGSSKWARVHEIDFMITSPPIFVLPAAIASAEAFGTPKLQLYIIPDAIASMEAFGTPALALIVAINGIASAEEFGTAWLINSSLSVAAGRELLPVRLLVRKRLLTPHRLLP